MINKQATPNNWQKILSGLRKITNLPPKVREYVNDPNKIEFPQSAENPRAIAYVTNEDYNNDGRNDSLKVHIVVPTFNSAFNTSDIASMTEDSPEFKDAVERIAKTLVHEIEGHIKDFNPDDSNNPFPGGEPAAEAAESSFNPIWASSTINYIKKRGGDMKKDLVKLANHLDKIGHGDLSDRLDIILANLVEDNFTDSSSQQPVEDEDRLPTEEEADQAVAAKEGLDALFDGQNKSAGIVRR